MNPPDIAPPRVCSILIDVPVQEVWSEITKTGAVQRPLYNTVLSVDLEEGGSLRYASPDGSRVFVAGKVLEVDPPHRLRHTYIFTMKPEVETEVTWELEAVDGGCRVTVTHAGWSTEKDAAKHAAGWEEILGLLKSELETGDIPTKTKVIYRVQSWFMFALPGSTRKEYADERGW